MSTTQAATTIMSWIDALPNVESTDFQQRRDLLAAQLKEGEQLRDQAEEMRLHAEDVLGKVHLDFIKLEACAKRHWSFEVVETVKGQ